MPHYEPFEMIAFTGARVLEDETTVFVGMGLPIVAATLARLTRAPKLNMIFEAGSLSAVLDQGTPLSVGDTRACRRAVYAKGLCDIFELGQRGYADYAFFGGAQIDMYGNVNCHFRGGSYHLPALRLAGSGGAGAMAASCHRTIAVMALERCCFVEQLDFVSAVGYGDGSPGYRKKAGLPGSGPYRVITDQALFGFDDRTRRMMLLETAKGVSAEDVMYRVGFDLLVAPDLKEMAEPTEEDLLMLRGQCDPDGYFLKRRIQKEAD